MKEVDKGIRLLTLSTSVRWFGWGLGDTFIPVFFLLFAGGFFETGLLASIYYITFFLFIPFAGMFADNFKAKYLILFGLLIYVLIGLGYFLAGMTGMIVFLIVARGLNGVSFSLDQIGRESYFIRHTSKKKGSSVFGYFDKITGLWWIIGILIGFILIKYVEIHWLLLMVVPTSIVSFLIVLRLKEKRIKKKVKFENPYLKMFREVKGFNWRLKRLAIIVFFFDMMSTVIYYFAPAVTYSRGTSLVGSAVLILAYSIPSLFGESLGKFADRVKYKGYYLCICSLILVLLVLAFSPNYYLLLASMFIAGLSFELSNLTHMGVMARNSDFGKIGEVDGALSSIGALGSILGPIIFGLLLSIFSPMHSYFFATGVVVWMFAIIYRGR